MSKKTERPITNKEPRIVKLCCGTGGHPCCPTVTIMDAEVIITDDFGGEVVLTRAQLAQLQELSV